MKIKSFVTSLIAGASLFTMVGTASAACTYRVTGDLNVYGASAQFAFFAHEFTNYLDKAGCTPKFGTWAASTVQDAATNPSHYAVQADCSAVGGPATVNFRVSSKASYDGPLAVDNQIVPGITTNNCPAGNQRELLHGGIAGCAWGNLNCGAPTAARGDCEVVNWGASDVNVTDFQQQLLGGRNFKTSPVVMLNGTSDFCNPAAIPFAFFVNNSVVKSDGVTILDNISDLEAKMIFAGNLTNWNQLNSSAMTAQPVVACYRNPGSGTHATLDFMVVRPDTMVKAANATHIFGESTGNEMSCISTNLGAIGYADADRLTAFPIANVSGPLKYNGVLPSSATMINGTYPYTDGAQHAYVTPASALDGMFQDICWYAGRPDKLALVNPLYAATCQMNALPKNFGTLGTWAPTPASVKGQLGCTCVGL